MPAMPAARGVKGLWGQQSISGAECLRKAAHWAELDCTARAQLFERVAIALLWEGQQVSCNATACSNVLGRQCDSCVRVMSIMPGRYCGSACDVNCWY